MTKTKPRRLQEPYRPLREQYKRQHPTRETGKREATLPKSRPLWRLVVSGLILAVVVCIKLTMPEVMDTYREDLLHLMGEHTDFTAVFSGVGQAIGEGEIAEVFNDVYITVFGGEPVEEVSGTVDDRNAVIYTQANTPYADMLQHMLGFETANPAVGKLSSRFGYRDHPTEENERFHYGLDIAAEKGTIISAFADGKVTAIGNSSELGKYVEVSHGGGYTTLYAHCSKITASSGQTVRLGDPIAEVGDSGTTTGCHLHFSLCQDTLYLNPIYYVSY